MKEKIKQLTSPLIKHRKNIAPIWFLPMLALIIGVWLIWRSLIDAGPTIKIAFTSGDGIVVNQTALKYKGLSLGVVKDLEPSADLSKMIATVEFDRRATRLKDGLPEDTKFWLVQPEVSWSGVSGLSALVSGNFISGELGSSKVKSQNFVALESPPVDFKEPGLHLTLTTSNLGSIARDSPIYFKQFQVGKVKGYQLDAHSHQVQIFVLINPDYTYLINDHTRFWNASGLSFNVGLSGVNVKTQSVATLLAGGIALDSSQNPEAKSVSNGYSFQLFDSEASAGATVPITLNFPTADYITSNQTQIQYQGIVIGVIKDIQPNPNGNGVIVNAGVKPEAESLLRTDSRFWLVRPEISAGKVTGLDALSGAYITLYPGKGEPSDTFNVSLSIPPVPASTPGLHLTLESEDSGELNVGSPILFRKLQAGSVQSIRFSPENKKVLIDIYIDPAYAKEITDATRFWNASGVDISGSLSHLKMRVGSVATIIQGGIMFDQLSHATNHAQAKNGDHFALFSSRGEAETAGLSVQLHLDSAEGLRIGSEIKHRGLQIGEITQLQFDKNLEGVTAYAALRLDSKPLLNSGAVFWKVSPQLGLARTENIGTLITGSYLQIQPGIGTPTTTFTVSSSQPVQKTETTGLNLILVADDVGSIKINDPVLYRRLPIGRVLGAELAEDGKQVHMYINIQPKYAKLVSAGSRFIDVSGIKVDAGLFSGVHISTQSVETILAGGIALEESDTSDSPAQQGARFILESSK